MPEQTYQLQTEHGFPEGRTVARLCREHDGVAMWTAESVASLVGQEPTARWGTVERGRVRIVRAWLEDGWVVVEMEPVEDEVGEPAVCSTCGDTGVVEQHGIPGAPGSACRLTCPDCGPNPVRAVDG